MVQTPWASLGEARVQASLSSLGPALQLLSQGLTMEDLDLTASLCGSGVRQIISYRERRHGSRNWISHPRHNPAQEWIPRC